jgi:hypothetical protein
MRRKVSLLFGWLCWQRLQNVKSKLNRLVIR